MNTINWPGQSGKSYTYFIYEMDSSFQDKPGNYIFAKETSPGYWKPVYIGQTENLNRRLGNHNEEGCAKRNGATHIHVHINGIEINRKVEEKDLIKRWKPTCNEVYVY